MPGEADTEEQPVLGQDERQFRPIKRHRAFAHERQLLCVDLPLRAAHLTLPESSGRNLACRLRSDLALLA